MAIDLNSATQIGNTGGPNPSVIYKDAKTDQQYVVKPGGNANVPTDYIPYVSPTADQPQPNQPGVAPQGTPSAGTPQQTPTISVPPPVPPQPAAPQVTPTTTGGTKEQQLQQIAQKIATIKDAVSKLTAEQLKQPEIVGQTAQEAAASVKDTTQQPIPPTTVDIINQGFSNLQKLSDQYSQLMANQPSMVETYTKLLADQGVTADKMELVNLQNVMLGSKEDIRNELIAAGAPVTESGVEYLAAYRNRFLQTRADQLSNTIQAKEAYVDQIVNLTGQDRKTVSDQITTQFDLVNKQVQLQVDLAKTQATEDLAWQRYAVSAQNTAMTKAMELAKAGGLTGASKERLQALSDASGGMITADDLKRMNSYAVNHQDAQLQTMLAALQLKQDTLNSSGGVNSQGFAIGTTGSSKIDRTQEGYATIPLKDAGGLTQAAIDQAALNYAMTGVMPSIGLGSTGTAAQKRNAIQNRAAEIDVNGNIASNKAQLSALTKALGQQTSYAAQTERSLKSAEQGLEQVVGTFKAKGINNYDLTVANVIANAAKYQLDPADIAAFRAGLTEVANEYSQVFSRGGQQSETTRKQAQEVIDGNISINALQKVTQELQAQGKIVLDNANGQVDSISKQINGIVDSSVNTSDLNSPAYNEDLAKTTVTNYGNTNPQDRQTILDLVTKPDPTLGRPMTYSEVLQYLQQTGKIQ